LISVADRHEVGAHSLTHQDLRYLSKPALVKEIKGSKVFLEDAVGHVVDTFCYPKGQYNRRVREAVENAGFLGARTTREFSLTTGDDPFRMPVTLLTFPLPPVIRLRHELITLNLRGLRTLLTLGIKSTWVTWAETLFFQALELGGVLHLFGHSWEIEGFRLWDDLREVFGVVSRKEGVDYLTNGQALSRHWPA
jgi:hypothetical protein